MNRLPWLKLRLVITALIVIGIEIYFYRRYAALGAEFHFWVHGLFGAALGITGLTLWRLARRKTDGWMKSYEAGFLGHVYSAVPDVIFLLFGILHMYWMDIFALHISVHFIPAPVPTMLGLFILSLIGYGLAADGKRRPAYFSFGVAGTVLCIALLLRSPIPANLEDLQQNTKRAFWMCPLIDVTVAHARQEHHEHH